MTQSPGSGEKKEQNGHILGNSVNSKGVALSSFQRSRIVGPSCDQTILSACAILRFASEMSKSSQLKQSRLLSFRLQLGTGCVWTVSFAGSGCR